MQWLSSITVLSVGAIIGGLPFTLLEYAGGHLNPPDMQGWLVMVFTAIVPSIISQACFIGGVELIGPNRGGLFINLVPIFGTFFAVTLLGEQLHLYHLVAPFPGARRHCPGGTQAGRRRRAGSAGQPVNAESCRAAPMRRRTPAAWPTGSRRGCAQDPAPLPSPAHPRTAMRSHRRPAGSAPARSWRY